MAAPSPVQVVIRGRTYNLAGGQPEHARALARKVDETMAQFSRQMVGADSYQIAILTALHIADELAAATSELSSFRMRVDDVVGRVQQAVDETLAEDEFEAELEPEDESFDDRGDVRTDAGVSSDSPGS